MNKRISSLTLLILAYHFSWSATSTTTFTVTATVINSCSISATSNLVFGNYDPNTPTPTDATNTLSVTCSTGLTYNVGLNGGSSGNVNNRQMQNGASVLNYALYRDAGRTQNWGTTIGTDTYSGTGNGATQSLTVYGRIPAGQVVPFGSYSDTITATITFP